jgi:hypothetical protein
MKKDNCPQISQITQTLTAEVAPEGFKGYQTAASQACLDHLCNLRNLRRKSAQETL